MPSIVAQSFRAKLIPSLSDAGEMLDGARGSGPEYREMHRALLLGDRASRDWAALAIASQRPGAPNHFEQLGEALGRPEDAYHVLGPAARLEAAAAASPEQAAVAGAVRELAAVVEQLDTEATPAGNAATYRAVGEAAAGVLVAAATILGGEEFIVAQANQVLAELVALAGWVNRLGPRYE